MRPLLHGETASTVEAMWRNRHFASSPCGGAPTHHEVEDEHHVLELGRPLSLPDPRDARVLRRAQGVARRNRRQRTCCRASRAGTARPAPPEAAPPALWRPHPEGNPLPGAGGVAPGRNEAQERPVSSPWWLEHRPAHREGQGTLARRSTAGPRSMAPEVRIEAEARALVVEPPKSFRSSSRAGAQARHGVGRGRRDGQSTEKASTFCGRTSHVAHGNAPSGEFCQAVRRVLQGHKMGEIRAVLSFRRP